MAEELEGGRPYRPAQVVGLFLGPLVFAVLLLTPAPPGLSDAGWTTAALAAWMATWWAIEALPLAAMAPYVF